MPYYESEFGLIQAQNEQLTRENKKLVAVLEQVKMDIEFESLGLGELKKQIKQALAPYQEECTCLPDLPDGRAHGHCPACEADNSKEIPY